MRSGSEEEGGAGARKKEEGSVSIVSEGGRGGRERTGDLSEHAPHDPRTCGEREDRGARHEDEHAPVEEVERVEPQEEDHCGAASALGSSQRRLR